MLLLDSCHELGLMLLLERLDVLFGLGEKGLIKLNSMMIFSVTHLTTATLLASSSLFAL
jgi:hypothetical protein